MPKSFSERRLENPDFEIEVWIRGVKDSTSGDVFLKVIIEGEDDSLRAAGILERAAELLRDP